MHNHAARDLLNSLIAVAAMLAWNIPVTGAAVDSEPREQRRPLTALVLSGGGARGAAHIGVLDFLERSRIPIDLVVGTSMGSIVGGLYATGLSPEQIETRLLAVDWREVYSDRPQRKNVPFRRKQDDGLPLFDFEMGLGKGLKFQPGLIAGQHFGFSLQSWTMHTAGVAHFDDLPLPFRAVATDLGTGNVVVLERGNVGTAIRASIAIPSVLTPVEIDGRVLVDGGVVRNLPVDIARDLGAERIIAVDISSPLGDLSKMSMFSVAARSLSIFSEQNVKEQRALLGPQDVLLTPDLEGVTASIFDVETLLYAIDQGANAARKATTSLERFAVPPAEYERFLERQRRDVSSLVVDIAIDQVRVEGYSRVAPKQILTRVRSAAGTTLDLARLKRDLDLVYEIGEFQHVEFRLAREDERTILIIDVQEKPWGPNYLRFGLALESNIEGRGEFSVLGQLTRTQINPLGAEWKSRVSIGSADRLFTEFYQPLDWRGFFFVAPRIEYIDTEVSAPSAGGELERIQIDLLGAALDIGIQFRNHGEFRVGVFRGSGNVDILTESSVEPFRFEQGGWLASLTVDRFDNANFPRAGALLTADLYLSRETLGSDSDYDELELYLAAAFSLGKNTVLVAADAVANLGSDLPFFEGVSLGGFLNLSGLEPGSMTGQVGGVLSAVYYRQVGLMTPTLGQGIYVGGSVEAGGAWQRSRAVDLSAATWAGSLFVGADTKFGPLYLGYGMAETGDDALYFFMGRLFAER